MTDDDKQGAEPDPWAGLDADADGDAGGQSPGDDAAFIFDMLGDDSDDGAKPAPDEPGQDDGAGDDVGIESAGVPLAVFPPPDSDFASSDDDSVRTVPEPAAASEADGESSFPLDEIDGFAGLDDRDSDPDPFDGAAIARDLAGGASGDDASDFDGESGLPPADDVSFNADALPAGDPSPFADPSPFSDMGQADPFAMQVESSTEESAAVPLATTAAAAVAAPLPATRKKKSGIGQILGVVLGGVMALPVTYAILIWGFHKDPFKLARKLPDQVAFLVPQSLRQGGAGPGGRPGTAGPRSMARTLDEIDRPADEATADAAPSESMAADGAAAEPAAADDSSAEGPAKPAGEEKMVADAAALPDDEDTASAALALFKGRDVPPELAEEFRAAVAKLATTEDIEAALARLRAEEPPAATAMPAEPPPVPMPIAAPEPPPLDLTAVETAVAGAAEALDALETVSDVDDPARKRLMVDWYRRLATVGEACTLLETAAVDAGRPLESSPDAIDGMLGRIQSSDVALDDLRTLGRMWLGSQKRRADGTVLVATAESVRQIGPYWSIRAALPGPEGAGRVVAVISRRQPAVDIGDQIIITGVLFDTDTVWAADVRPLDSAAGDIGELPAIGIPPLFQEPTEPLPVVNPPMLKDAGIGEERQPAAAQPALKAGDDAPEAATKPAAADDEKPAADAAADAAENAAESDAAPGS